MMRFETVDYEVDEAGVGWVTLDRPEVLNAYSIRMRDELFDLLGNIALDSSLRIVVFRGAGSSFCAGADLSEFGTAPSAFAARRIRFARDVWKAVRALPVPSLAVLHGHVIGSGLELALHCDLRLAAMSARLRMPEAMIGLLPAAGGTQLLPRICGGQSARRLLLLGEAIDGRAAYEAGIVDRVASDDALAGEAASIIETLVSMPQEHVSSVLRLVRLGADRTPAAAVRAERLLGRAAAPPGV